MLRPLKTIIVTTLLAGVMLVAGCTPPGPKFTKPINPATGKAIIYVYRASFPLTNGELPGVKLNDSLVVSSLPHLNYFAIAVEPGSYTFTPKLFGIYGTTPAEVTAEAGKTYFVRMRMEIGHIGFYSVPANDAMAYMADCYMIRPGFAKDARVLTTAPAEQATATPQETAPEPEAAPTPVAEPVVTPQPAPAPAPVVTETQLFVQTQPSDARVRIMNIKPQFEQGIVLAPGRYKVDVSAKGYKSHVEWVTLGKGEKRTMQVALVSAQPQASAPAPQAEPVATPPQKTVAAPVPVVKKTTKVPANLSAEEKRTAKLLQSESATDLRTGAKSVYYRHSNNQYLTDLASDALLKNYNENIRDRDHVDAMAWLCKALGKSGNARYRATLENVAKSGKNRKLRGYASKNLAYL